MYAFDQDGEILTEAVLKNIVTDYLKKMDYPFKKGSFYSAIDTWINNEEHIGYNSLVEVNGEPLMYIPMNVEKFIKLYVCIVTFKPDYSHL